MDSCCFIDMVKQQVGELDADRESDVWHLKKLLEAHEAREVEVYTSVLTIAECIYAGKSTDPTIPDRFKRLLTSGQYVVLIQPTPFMAEDARDLYWKHGLGLKGGDALHIASAMDRSCQEFLTTDDKLTREAVSSKLKGLGLSVVGPEKTGVLPDHYRQLEAEGLD